MKGRVGESGYEGESLTVEGILLGGDFDFWEEAFQRGTGALVSWLGFSGSVGEFCKL